MSSETGETRSQFVALRDRAYAFVAARQPNAVAEDALLAHTYSGLLPRALHAQLVAPLLDDPRLERRADASWAVVGRRAPPPPTRGAADLGELELTALALAATGPRPARGRVVRISARHLQAGLTLGHFTATLNPDGRVPRYVAERLGLTPGALEDLPAFATIVDELIQFLGARPVVAQDARLTWAFVEAEARRAGRVVVEPLLVDANELATRVLDLKVKPTLAVVAAQLGIGTVRIGRPEEEARVLAQVTTHLLALANRQNSAIPEKLLEIGPHGQQTTLRRRDTAQSLPDEPGVYVLRDADRTALYVGKARRLRSRVAAYVQRPLGATRRLEGLVGSVGTVDSTVCATDLEALVLEDREIRRLQPRFNTVRRQRTPRVWIRLPPIPEPRPGARQRAARRLEPSFGPQSGDGEFVGPFRNEMLAEQARLLAREVFELDKLRRGDQRRYEERLRHAWDFLTRQLVGDNPFAETLARARSTRLVREVLAFDLAAMLLPADPRLVRYAVVRYGQRGIEGFVVDRGILQTWSVMHDDDASQLASDLLADTDPRTTPDDVDIVLRWLGAQRPPARHVLLDDDQAAAADAIEAAVLDLADGSGKT